MRKSQQRTWLVTGAQGQLGSEIQFLAESYGDHFLFTDRDTLDITSSTSLHNFFNQSKCDLILNVAAYTAVDQAEVERSDCERINCEGVRNLVRFSKEKSIPLIHLSTDYVFDGTSSTPYHEKSPTHPLGVYGLTKRKGEEIILESEAKACIIRTSWLYSKFGHNFVKTVCRLLHEKSELRIVYDQVGSPTHAADLAHFILHYGDSLMSNEGAAIYHFSNSGVTTWYDLAVCISKKLGLPKTVIPIQTSEYPTKAKRPAYSVLSKEKIRREFNYIPPHWEESLDRMIRTMV